MMGMDALLRFNSAALEKEFWASGPVRATLLGADRAAVFIVIFNNGLMAAMMNGVGAAAELRTHLVWTALFIAAQLQAMWLLQRDPGAYYRRRNAIMAFHRLMRTAAAVAYGAIRGGVLQVPAPLVGGGGGGGGMRELIRLFALRSGLPVPWIHVLNFPVPFPQQLLQIALLALALAFFRAWPDLATVMPTLAARPDLLAAVCRLHAGIERFLLVPRRFTGGDSSAGVGGAAGGPDTADACPLSAPALVVLWLQLVGLLAPLAAAYVIELRAKGAFLRARGLQPPAAALNVALGMAAALIGVTHAVWLTGSRLA